MHTIGGAANAYIATAITQHAPVPTSISVTDAWILGGG